jgi:uncharacterized protein YbbC (DUF1343 family)/CubicO group peptidase (beta-lactamase class C family)
MTSSTPEAEGMSSSRLGEIDAAVDSAIKGRQVPGAVVLVARSGHIVYRKAFGNKVVEPRPEPMALDTVFDLASLTKVVATATSIMILVERGKISLADPVAAYIPEFGRMGKERITVEQLLTHRAGLPPDNDISDYVGVTASPLQSIYDLRPMYEPGTAFVYSDVGYIVAAEIVRRVSGKRLDEFARENIFQPLGMRDTRFLPLEGTYHTSPGGQAGGASASSKDETENGISGNNRTYLDRIASTENKEGRFLHGEVHDPRSYALGGVAGHAGLFSTAEDLAVFCQMILESGEYNGVRILAPYTVKRMTSSIALPGAEMRGIGWDVNTAFSSNRGDLFPIGTFGHTGFTGTSLWIDPWSQTFVVLLTNRVHPDGKGSDTRLRSVVASIAAASIISPPYAPIFGDSGPSGFGVARAPIVRGLPESPVHEVLTGVDVLEKNGFKELEGRRIGLVTNQTGLDRAGRSTIDVLKSAPNLKLVALFSPEHGIGGAQDAFVPDQRDKESGLPIYSLYGRENRSPSEQQLQGIDTLVYDIQDVGARFYTYVSTCGYLLETAANYKLRVVILDRPDPINGYEIEGPIPDPELTRDPAYSFTCYYTIPVRYGLSIGELASLLNSEKSIGADLTIIKMEGWRRADYFDGTGVMWTNTSPNMRSLTEAELYPGIGLLETTNLSVGRGTDTPFELVGAPWIDGRALADALNNSGLGGIRFVPVRFTPSASKYAGEPCGGVNLIITDRGSFHPVASSVQIACALVKLYPGEWKADDYLRLIANRAVVQTIKAGKPAHDAIALWQPDLAAFAKVRNKYLLY